jgi:arsenite-transporting ATPase
VTSRPAEALVRALPRTALVVGKGGVGKTTCAAALALQASRDQRTLVVTTDPARALPTVLGRSAGPDPTPIGANKKLFAQALDATVLRARFLERWGDVIRAILDRGTYLDETDIAPVVDTALPGGDEIFSALALAELLVKDGADFERVFVDTAPTGHTLRLLNLPSTFRALVRLLDAMQEKHRFMVRALTRTYRVDDADAFLAEMKALVDGLDASLHDPARCAAVMVTNTQSLVLNETRRYLDALRDLHVAVAAVVWNGSDSIAALNTDARSYVVPRLDDWPIGEEGLARWLRAVKAPSTSTRSKQGVEELGAGEITKPDAPVAPGSRLPTRTYLRPLTIVAGKGGVGKTTVACALALQASTGGKRTLVVSTDPAPSLADAFAQPIADADVPVAGAENLSARQMDASAAFSRLRVDYQTRVDALFEALMGRGIDLAHDRLIARDLLSLAPPGVDEVYALSRLADALFGGHYDCVIVDPAPTGHLLRLLEMPQLALGWTHQIMRLMLKYKDVAGLGEAAQDLLDFSRSLRSLDVLLHDAARCGVVLVTLDQPVVREESERLAVALGDRGTPLVAVIVNRAATHPALPAMRASVQLEAPAAQPSPIGPRALRAWADTWRQTQA